MSPGPAGCPGVGLASAAAATHVVVMEQIVSILILVVLDHGHRAYQLAHGHLLPRTQDKARGLGLRVGEGVCSTATPLATNNLLVLCPCPGCDLLCPPGHWS